MPVGPRLVYLCCLLVLAPASRLLAADAKELVAAVKGVDRQGKGHVEAQRALAALSAMDAHALAAILHGFRDADPLEANWLRGAFETIAERALQKTGKLPTTDLERFLADRTQHPRARRMAFEYLVRVDNTASDRLVPGMIDDPSAELRREAVARLIGLGAELNKGGKKDEAIKVYQHALAGALDDDQVKQIVGPLRALGQKVDLQKHFGLLTSWQVIGPFDNKGGVGLRTPYPPEMKIDLDEKIEGQLGEVSWTPITTKDEYGVIDIAKQVHPYKGAVMYALATFNSPQQRAAEIRLGTPNAWSLWVNNKKIFEREEYHHGTRLDQYRVGIALQPGKNIILLKVCQNEQNEEWAQRFQFQLRVCDRSGAAIRSADAGSEQASAGRPPAATAAGQSPSTSSGK